jgi:hypothetical protein
MRQPTHVDAMNWAEDNAAFWREYSTRGPRGVWAWVCGWYAVRRAYGRCADVWEKGKAR